MSDEASTVPYDPEERFHEALASFEQAVDAELNPDPEEWLADYPDVADRLREHFAAAGLLKQLAEPPSPEAPAPPPAVKGYRILGPLGAGGMGMVYLAVQEVPDRKVALKVIRPDRLDGLPLEQRREALQRFRTEARAAARLGHEGIVPVFEVGEADGRPFYSMRYVEGASLADLIEKGPLEPRRAAAYLERVARAVHEAHRHGILHRDLKPENALVEAATDRVFVADFGLAKLAQEGAEGTRTGAVMGTPPYMSPEQAQDSAHVTVASDVYSLGATLYALLTGRSPFPEKEPPAVKLRRVIEEEPVPPRRLRPELPRDLETICLKCLHKDPYKRYASADELAGRLRLFLEGRPIPDRPTGKAERLWRWCRRNPALAAALTVAAALLLGGTGVSSYFALAEAEQARTALKAHDNLKKSNAELLQSQEKLEIAFSRSLLRPLAELYREALPPTAVEIEAVWELASQPSEGVRRRFVSEALQSPMFTRQLRNRAKLTLHAAVGLDVRRRQEVERLLLARLKEQAVLEDQRTDIALVAAALGDLSPQAAAAIGRILTQAMTKATDPYALKSLAQGLAAVAGRLEPEGAARLCAQAARALSLAMTKTTGPEDGLDMNELVEGLAAVAGRLEPEGAAQAARALTQDMTETTPGVSVGLDVWLPRGLAAVADRLEPKEAAQVARALTEAMATARSLGVLAQGLAAVAGRLEPKEAARLCAQAARALTQDMTETTNPYDRASLAEGLAAVAGRLEPKEAARLCAQAARALTQDMTETTDTILQHFLARGLAAVAAHLEPKEAAQVARALTQAMAKTPDSRSLGPLAQGLAAVAAHLEPEEAAQVARALTEAMATAPSLGVLAQGLAAVAGRLEPKEAAQAARTLTQAMATDPRSVGLLAEGLAAVAGRLEPEEAARLCAQAARALTQAMTKITNRNTQVSLAQGLAAVADRLEPKEAAQAARALTQAMTKATDPYALKSLAQGLAAVAGRLEPEGAARLCAEAARALSLAMTKTTGPEDLNYLAEALAAVAAHLEPKDAASTLTQAMSKATRPEILNSLAHGLAATLTEGARTLPVRAAGLVGGVAVSDRQPLPAPAALVLALEPPPCRLSTQQLVDLLKHPLYIDQARRVVLEQLENRYRRPFADHWEFVRFARAQNLGLDFTTPPLRPEAPSPQARK